VCVFRDVSEEIALRAEVLRSADDHDRRIGQELHDNTGQQLMGLGLLADNLAEALAEKSLAEGQNATRIADGLGESLKEVRLLSQRLIPVELDSRGLMSALTGLASRTNALRDIECVFECQRPVEILNSFCATNLYRIAQEAISNALKHSDARNITVTLEVDGGSVHLSICDDGVGIGERTESKGMGLRIMKYRAKLMGAQFACGPADRGGTLVTCVLAGASGR
jgi:signal transduction histidine kinase